MKIEHTEGKVKVSLEQPVGQVSGRWFVEIEGYGGYGKPECVPQRFEATSNAVISQLIKALEKVAEAKDALS